MYDVTITNCNTLEVTHKRVENPLEVLEGIDWVERHAQHQVEEQIDIQVTASNGDIIQIKAREMTGLISKTLTYTALKPLYVE